MSSRPTPAAAAARGPPRSLSSRSCLSARAVPIRPRGADRLHAPAASPAVLAWPSPTGWPLPRWCNEAESGSLIAAAHAFAFRGFACRIAPTPRPVGYMANGSFHGGLLSFHETRSVSLTHRRHGDTEARFLLPWGVASTRICASPQRRQGAQRRKRIDSFLGELGVLASLASPFLTSAQTRTSRVGLRASVPPCFNSVLIDASHSRASPRSLGSSAWPWASVVRVTSAARHRSSVASAGPGRRGRSGQRGRRRSGSACR